MVKFLDGPAAGVTLSLHRAPVLLRVVRSRNGNWDALDQLDDEPKPSETIHVYRLASEVTNIHLCIRGKGKRGSGWYAMAEYRELPEQPGDEHTRSTEAWRAWCQAFKKESLQVGGVA